VGSKDDDARPGKPNKTPKCLFSTTQARGRKRGGLNSYHQRQGMTNANGRDYSWGICDIRYEIGHPKIFRVRETVSLKFGWVRFSLGLRKTVITTKNASSTSTRRWTSNEDDEGPNGQIRQCTKKFAKRFANFRLERRASILELDS
jgi:hypothetical protein